MGEVPFMRLAKGPEKAKINDQQVYAQFTHPERSNHHLHTELYIYQNSDKTDSCYWDCPISWVLVNLYI